MNRLLYFRNRANLTVKELADKSGVDGPKINRVERGIADLTGQRWLAIADALDCSVDELLGRKS